jgi:hypothetical protein
MLKELSELQESAFEKTHLELALGQLGFIPLDIQLPNLTGI